MLIVVVITPLLIVKSCGSGHHDDGVKPKDDLLIKVYVKSEDITKQMGLDEYLKGVVAAEMPASFEPEALKAQAVAARTYAFARYKKVYSSNNDREKGADVCTDPGDCQAWISKDAAIKNWGKSIGSKNWKKIEKAVNDTHGIILVYNGAIANPVFHSNAAGRTENSEDVWDGVSVPYLKSVISKGDELGKDYKTDVTISAADFIKKLKGSYPSFKYTGKDISSDIQIIEYTSGGRAKTVKIANVTMKGTDFRKLFELKSANFIVQKADKDVVKLTTYGNGHGVGLSQWGANYLAKNGGGFEEILKHYYIGIQLDNVNNFN